MCLFHLFVLAMYFVPFKRMNTPIKISPQRAKNLILYIGATESLLLRDTTPKNYEIVRAQGVADALTVCTNEHLA